jgi:hypothetical protein
MTSNISQSITHQDIETALRFLGPADFAESVPQGCLDHLILVIKQIAIFLFRTINFICGDHQWHDNLSARQIVAQYYEDSRTEGNPELALLTDRVELLYTQLEQRAIGNISYADGINRNGLLSQQQPQLPLMGGVASQTVVSSSPGAQESHLAQLPHELLLEILKKLDAKSLSKLLLVSSHFYNSITNDPIFFKQALQEFAIKKMLTAAQQQDEMDIVGSVYSIAKLLAISHPRHALTAVNLLPEDHQNQILYEITCIQAMSDPDLALTTAQLIDDGSRDKSCAFSTIAKECVDTDPERANQLFQQSLDLTNILSNEDDKDHALSTIASALASSNIVSAIHIANRVQGPSDRRRITDEIAKTHALTDLNQALAIYERIINANGFDSSDDIHSRSLSEIASKQAVINPDLAVVTARKIVNNYVQCTAFANIAIVRSRQNPDQAIAEAQRLWYPQAKNHALSGIAKELALVDLEWAVTTARSIQDERSKYHALAEIAISLAISNPEQAIGIVNLITASRCYNYGEAERAIKEIASALAPVNPERAIAITTDEHLNSTGAGIDLRLLGIVKKLAPDHPDHAITAANTILEQPLKIGALCEIAKVQALTNRELPLQLLQTIEEQSSQINQPPRMIEDKLQIYCNLAKQVATSDPNQANRFYQKAFTLAFLNSSDAQIESSYARIIIREMT